MWPGPVSHRLRDRLDLGGVLSDDPLAVNMHYSPDDLLESSVISSAPTDDLNLFDWKGFEDSTMMSTSGSGTTSSAEVKEVPEPDRKPESSAADALNDLVGPPERPWDSKTLDHVSENIPRIIQFFALLELMVDSRHALEIADFTHKYRREIALRLKDQPRLNAAGPVIQVEATPGKPRGTSVKGKPHQFKINQPASLLNKHSVPRPTSAVCDWIVSRFLRERLLYLPPRGAPDSVRKFRKRVAEAVMAQVPPGKAHGTAMVTAGFVLPRLYAEALKEELTTIPERIVLTSSDPGQIQATTIRQYLNQTWPCGGTLILSVLERALGGLGSSSDVLAELSDSQDTSKIQAKLISTALLVKLTGPQHLVVERAEQLAWLSGAAEQRAELRTWASSRPRLQLISSDEEEFDTGRPRHPHRTYWELTQFQQALDRTDSTVRLLQQLQYRQTPLRSVPPVIWGFPTARRPHDDPGIELPWELLADLIAPEGLDKCIHKDYILLHGKGGRLRLVRNTDGVLVWHVLPTVTLCSCPSGIWWMSGGDDMRFLDVDGLRKFRHILGPCHVQDARICSEQKLQNTAAAVADATGGCPAQEKPGNPTHPASSSMPPRSGESDCESEVSDSSLHGSSIETEVLSISEDSEPEDELLTTPDPDDALFPFAEAAARHLLAHYRKETAFPSSKRLPVCTKSPGTHEQTSRPPHGPAPSESSSHHGLRHSYGSRSSAEKRGRGRNQDRDSEDEDSRKRQPPKKRKRKSPAGERRTLFLACPFWKLDPREHRSCFRFNLDGIARVKQHLTRKHAPQFYCEFCMAVLDDSESHQRHIAARACSFRSYTFGGITHQQQRELSKRSRANLSEAERWFAIWDIVFPGRPRPPSPYIDTTLSEDLCQFREFAHARGPAIIAAEIQANSEKGSCMISEWERDPAALQSSVFARCFALIFDEWLAEHADDSSPPGPAQQPETSAAQSDSSSTEASMEASTQPDANTQSTPATSASPGQDCPVTPGKGKGKDRADEASQQQEESGETDDSWMQEEGLGQDAGYLDSTWQPDFLFDNGFDDFQFGAAPTNREEKVDEMDIFSGAEEQSRVQHQGRQFRNTAWNSAYI